VPSAIHFNSCNHFKGRQKKSRFSLRATLRTLAPFKELRSQTVSRQLGRYDGKKKELPLTAINMGNLFNKSPAKKKPRRDQPSNDALSEVDQAKLEIRRTRTKLRKYQKQMEKETVRLNAKIKTLLQAGKKSQAKANLRLRKLRETALEQTDVQVLNLEQMICSLEQSEFNAEMVKSIETGNSALGHLQKIMSLEYVEEVMEEADELAAMNDEITDMISGSGYTVDDSEVAADLAALEEEINGGVESSVAAALDMPVAPTNELVQQEVKQDIDDIDDMEGRTLVEA
jgi:hypothetical protein